MKKLFRPLVYVFAYIVYMSLLLFSNRAFSEGKLTLRQPFYSYQDKYEPELGLYIREDLSKKYFYQSWTGGQVSSYFTSNQDIFYKVNKKLDFGIGGSLRYDDRKTTDYLGTVSIELKLW